MMNRNLMTAMRASISEVMETMFFEPIEFSEETDVSVFFDENRKNLIVVNVKYQGPFSGDLCCFMPKDLALSLASNFLGKEISDVSNDQAGEVVKEIVNMTAGGIFSHYDKNAVFQIGIPEIIKKTDMDDCGAEDAHFLLAETVIGRFALNLTVL